MKRRCDFCGTKIKPGRAIEHTEISEVHNGDDVKIVVETYYFCSEEHKLAWIYLQHIAPLYKAAILSCRDHLKMLHGWTDDDILTAEKVLGLEYALEVDKNGS